jgi:TetR/AcrR family transcriptional regulator
MTTNEKLAPAAVDGLDDESIPEWKRQSVDRFLKSAQTRAQDRTDRFVQAGIELIKRTGGTGFTVQDVVDDAHMSIRTFYGFFASKDDLLVAIHETILGTEVVPRLRASCDAEADPVDKIKAYITALFELSANPAPATRAFTALQHRLAEARPEDLDRAMQPQLDLVAELVRGAAATGRLREDLHVESSARLVHHLVLSIVEARVVGSPEAASVTPEQVWDFCMAAMGATLAPKRASRR